ncbi:MAG: prevent-host-death protein [Deltaproteobacteria bacterium RIFCSPLOWO2_02_FULL_53_8]|nr:MAG: prevent-host-death protein [Deltaproteobacteria bacterium RIFCSPLOWO2_02_FULL_53_8]
MLTVGIKELKAGLSGYVDKASGGETVVITDRGKEVALIVPISDERRALASLVDSDKAKWAGGKPAGMKGIRIKGKPLSSTVLEERR